MVPHALQPSLASEPRTTLPQRRIGRFLLAATAGGLAVILLIMAFIEPTPARQRWIAPHSTDQLQSFPARPDVLNVAAAE